MEVCLRASASQAACPVKLAEEGLYNEEKVAMKITAGSHSTCRRCQGLGGIARAVVAGVAVAIACTAQAASYKLTVKTNSSSRGTVSGSGTYAEKETVTVKAVKKSGYAFAGWFTDKGCTKKFKPAGYDYRKPTVKIEMPKKNTTIYGKFISKADAKKSLKFNSATKKYAKTAVEAEAGNEFSLKLGISSATLPTITAKDLPGGLSINKTTGKITGIPKKLGSYTATVTVKDAAGNKISQKVKFKVVMPDWAMGTFNGYAYIDGAGAPPSLLQFTVGSSGGISGKVAYRGKSYSFSSKCSTFSEMETKFKPTFVLGSRTYTPGTLKLGIVFDLSEQGFTITEAWTEGFVFHAQKRLGYVRNGGKFAGANLRTFTFTGSTPRSGLSSGDKLTIGLKNDVAYIKEGSTVGGVELSTVTLPMFLDPLKFVMGYPRTFYYQIYVVDYKANYDNILEVTIELSKENGPVKSVKAEFVEFVDND